jgi:hypothetical protein
MARNKLTLNKKYLPLPRKQFLGAIETAFAGTDAVPWGGKGPKILA